MAKDQAKGVEIWPSAYKHGISAEQIRHVAAHPMRIFETDNAMIMIIGGDPAANILEVGIGRSGAVVHAMPARKKFLKQLGKQ